MTDKTRYEHEILLLEMPDKQMADLLAIGDGGIMFDLEATMGGKYLFSACSERDASVAFLVEQGMPRTTRQFFVVPIGHKFIAPDGLDIKPLGVLMHPKSLLALYEVKQVSN